MSDTLFMLSKELHEEKAKIEALQTEIFYEMCAAVVALSFLVVLAAKVK